jgi:uroporphyrinogen III methyltransferase/synthase
MTDERVESSLTGRAIVIVGPETSNYDLFGQLKFRGAEVMTLPRSEVTELEHFERLDEAIDHLYGYDWLLFTNVNGVKYFLRRVQKKGLDSSALDELRVCAIGDDVEQLLREEHVHVDVSPSSSGKKQVFASLEQFVGGAGALVGLNFLSPRATTAADALARDLTDAGARIDLVPTYRTVSAGVDLARTAAMVSGAADCIVLSSAGSVTQLAQLFDSHDLGGMLDQVPILCFDEATARAASAAGLHVTMLPDQAPPAEVLQTMKDLFAG